MNLRFTLPLFLAALVLLPAGNAPAFSFHVDVVTAPLIGNAAGPFSLAFQLTDGSASLAAPNMVTINNFTFGSGSALGLPTLSGGAAGSLSSAISLSDSGAFLSDFYQSFVPGTTLGFDVAVTSNVDPGPIPDALSFSILDKNLANLPATGLGDSLMLFNINSAAPTLAAVQTFSSLSPAGITVRVSPAIPEPGTAFIATLLLGVCCGEMFTRPRRKSVQ